MQKHITSATGGATTTLSPTLGRAYRSGAATIDQLLLELMDQFKRDAMAIDPTIIGAWVCRDLTAHDRDPGGAVHGIVLEREHTRLVRKAGA
tara:strand:+ start:268 stop:543 length:276 start_codon:yes stop_codon:yes gene_type:complete